MRSTRFNAWHSGNYLRMSSPLYLDSSFRKPFINLELSNLAVWILLHSVLKNVTLLHLYPIQHGEINRCSVESTRQAHNVYCTELNSEGRNRCPPLGIPQLVMDSLHTVTLDEDGLNHRALNRSGTSINQLLIPFLWGRLQRSKWLRLKKKKNVFLF